MGVVCSIERGVFIVRYGEDFSTEEIADEMRRVMNDNDAFRPPMNILVDTRASEQNTPHAELRRRAETIATRPDLFGPRIAVIATTPLRHGQTRVASAYAEARGLQVRIFRDERSALSWLESQSRAPAEPHDRGDGTSEAKGAAPDRL